MPSDEQFKAGEPVLVFEDSTSSKHSDSHGSISPEAAGRETVVTSSDAAIGSPSERRFADLGTADVESDNGEPRPSSINSQKSPPGVGQLFAGQYDLLECLGQGGMGVVYKARDVALNRIVAIKLLRSRPGLSDSETLRFQQEARAIATLDHKNIIRLHAIATADDGAPYFVMEYLEGRSLADEIRLQKRLAEDRAIALAKQACDAIEHAHSKGVIHRDIKPSNLMLVFDKQSGQEIVKLVDFGIAKLHGDDGETVQQLTQTGELFGSPYYMSPEQCAGKKVNEKTDIYSLGCVLYEMLCGTTPFRGANAVETLMLHQTGEASPIWKQRSDLKAAESLDGILLKMLAKSASDRPAALEVRQQLEAALQEKAGLHRLIARLQSTAKRRTARTMIARATVIALLVLAVSLPLLSWSAAARLSKLPPSQITPDLFFNSWESYDHSGQLLFNAGEYKGAEEAFRRALFKAHISLDANRLFRQQTSLKELEYLYYATDNQAQLKEALSGLSAIADLNDPALVSAMEKLSSAEEKLNNKVTAENISTYVEAALQEAFVGSIRSEDQKSAELMAIVANRLNEIPGVDAMIGDKVQLSRNFFSRFAPAPSAFDGNLQAALLRRALNNPAYLQDNIVRIMVSDLCLMQTPLNAPAVKALIQPVVDDGTPFERAEAFMIRSRAEWLTKNYALADRDIQEAIGIYSRELPRRYGKLAYALYRCGMYQEQRMLYKQSIGYLKRAETIVTYAAPNESRLLNLIKRIEATSYTELGQFAEAEAILRSLGDSEARTDRNGLEQANTLVQRGYFYIKLHEYNKARQFLLDAVDIFRTHPNLPPASADPYARAMSNLRELALMSGNSKEVAYWGAEVKKLKGVERIVD